MTRFRRPELEKDNPIAPQIYVGRRRRRDASSPVDPQGRTEETLHALVEAAEQFVNAVPRLKRLDEQRDALLDAITHAQLLLSVDQARPPRPARSTTSGL